MYYNSGEFVNNNKEVIKSLLESNGYLVKDCNEYLTTQAKWRMGEDISSVTIYYRDNFCQDWVSAEKFDISELFKRVTGQKTEQELKDYLDKNNVVIQEIDTSPKIKQPKVFDKSLLNYIDTTNNEYLIGRGITEETCRLFETGFVGQVKGRLRNRIIFPVWNTKKTELIGFAGRAPNNQIKPKVILFGNKTEFIYPSHINDSIIEKCKSVILVESQIDVLWMHQNGILNTICLFGTELSYGVLNYLLRKNIEKVIISLNNEESRIGNNASIKCLKRLLRYFDSKSCIIKLPFSKDFNEMEKESLQKWMDELQIQVGYQYFNYC